MEFILPGNNHLLTDTRLNDHDALLLYKTLVNNSYVTTLEMKYNEITDEGAQHIGKLIEVLSVYAILKLMLASKGVLNLPTSSLHLCSPFNKIVRSRFTISSPFLYNNWVKIHCCENKVG